MLISLLVDIEKKSSTQVKIFFKSAGQVLTSSTDFYGPWSACRSVSSRGSYHDEMASVPQCVHVRSTHSRAWHPGSKAHRVLCDKSWMDLMWSCFSTQRLSLQHQLNISRSSTHCVIVFSGVEHTMVCTLWMRRIQSW